MMKPLVGVVVGTRADFNVMRRGLETLRVMGVPYVFDVLSPHRQPERIAEFAQTAGDRGIEIIIAASGGSSALVVQLSSHTALPIIGVPVDNSPLRGQDAMYAMTMVPTGLPVATVGINNSENAAILATQILALKYVPYRQVLADRRLISAQRVDSLTKELGAEYPDLCLAEETSSSSLTSVTEAITQAGTDTVSEAATPEPPPEEQRIAPGATFVNRKSGPLIQKLVSTPVPQEPGMDDPQRESSLKPLPIAAALAPKPNGKPATAQSEEVATVAEEVPKSPGKIPQAPGSAEAVAKIAVHQSEPAESSSPGLKTKIFTIDREQPDADLIDHAMMTLLEGGIVGIPTDTVYGLAADATNRQAVERLAHLKGREHQKTLGILIANNDMLRDLAREMSAPLQMVIDEFWPGALTVVVHKKQGALVGVTKTDRVGVRVPSDVICLSIIERIGRPLVMRNASVKADEPMVDPRELSKHYDGHVDCILDAGRSSSSIGASTVLSALGEKFEVLREGHISKDAIRDILGDHLKD